MFNDSFHYYQINLPNLIEIEEFLDKNNFDKKIYFKMIRPHNSDINKKALLNQQTYYSKTQSNFFKAYA